MITHLPSVSRHFGRKKAGRVLEPDGSLEGSIFQFYREHKNTKIMWDCLKITQMHQLPNAFACRTTKQPVHSGEVNQHAVFRCSITPLFRTLDSRQRIFLQGMREGEH